MNHIAPTNTRGRVERLRLEDYLDGESNIVIPDGATLISVLYRNIIELGDAVSYRHLDYGRVSDSDPIELSCTQLGTRLRAIGARLQQVSAPRDRVAILASTRRRSSRPSAPRFRGDMRCRWPTSGW